MAKKKDKQKRHDAMRKRHGAEVEAPAATAGGRGRGRWCG